jgi:hypothetical protein
MCGTSRINQQGNTTANMKSQARFITNVLVCFLPMVFLMMGGGCALFSQKQEPQAPIIVLPIFPPQEVMQNGDYTGFLRESQAALAECKDDDRCAIAIFGIAFVYAYPGSPYYDLMLGLHYFNDLVSKYPNTPWALQAKVWSEFMKKSIASEKSKHQLKNAIKTKETTIKDLSKQIEHFEENEANIRDLEKRIGQSKGTESEIDKREIDKREKELEKLIERSRQIDIEMDRKERELLQ